MTIKLIAHSFFYCFICETDWEDGGGEGGGRSEELKTEKAVMFPITDTFKIMSWLSWPHVMNINTFYLYGFRSLFNVCLQFCFITLICMSTHSVCVCVVKQGKTAKWPSTSFVFLRLDFVNAENSTRVYYIRFYFGGALNFNTFNFVFGCKKWNNSTVSSANDQFLRTKKINEYIEIKGKDYYPVYQLKWNWRWEEKFFYIV